MRDTETSQVTTHIETEVAPIKDQSNLGQTETSAALTLKTKFKSSLQEHRDLGRPDRDLGRPREDSEYYLVEIATVKKEQRNKMVVA